MPAQAREEGLSRRNAAVIGRQPLVRVDLKARSLQEHGRFLDEICVLEYPAAYQADQISAGLTFLETVLQSHGRLAFKNILLPQAEQRGHPVKEPARA